MGTHENTGGMGTPALFRPCRIGALDLPNRLVMAPMTRSRALAGSIPHPLAATYYAQRASAGLIITEATHASPDSGSCRHRPMQCSSSSRTPPCIR